MTNKSFTHVFKSFLSGYNYMNKNGDFNPRMEERGGVSSSLLAFKGTCTKTGCCEQSCF